MKTGKTIAMMIACTMLLSGCSSQEKSSVNYPDSDVMSNPQNIMETANGFYIGNTSLLFLQYHDKQSGNDIMLCDKPECPHDGRETCTATYKGISPSNIVFYNNDLYFTGTEGDGENAVYSLYKVKSDGSSLDKVCTLLTLKNDSDTSDYMPGGNIVIHRGYAFIDTEIYDINGRMSGGSYTGFMGGGFSRVNLRTNEVTQISKYEDYFAENVDKIIPCGDYIFTESSDSSHKSKTRRIRVDSDTPEEDFRTSEIDAGYILAADSSFVYAHEKDFQYEKGFSEYKMIKYNPETMERIDEFNVEAGAYIAYDGKLISYPQYIGELENAKIFVYENGKKTAEINDLPDDKEENMYLSFSCGKMYIQKPSFTEHTSIYYSCPFEDVLSGNIRWKEELNNKELSLMWKEYIEERAKKGLVKGWSAGY